ncbi:hypothetical protein M407DRAFT_21861 [Tulasnella calospora MUT 4182]|uniref:Uncharacterized protein n=1 Tax=Tulasnella calospora MUT 4182 TaxID=1051891 RepID=A0A0C3QDD5_9AGAM|nr:hypothetical protein M407DRAFT_21861 [Tulasnella calospora MUT 4182]
MLSPDETQPLLQSPKRGISLNEKTAISTIIAITLGFSLSGIIAWWITSPNSLVGKALGTFFTLFGLISDERVLESCSLLYAFFAYAFTPGISVAGVGLGTAGYTHGDPRHAKLFLTGLPARMTASHQNLLETFPIYALVAALTALLGSRSLSAPAVALYDHAANLLALHVFCKTIIYIPAYLQDLGELRSVSHFLGIGALLAVLYQLTFGSY